MPAHNSQRQTSSTRTYQRFHWRSGFTLVEVLLAISLVAISYTMVTLSLSNMIPRASVVSATDLLVSDLRYQQLQAMSGRSYRGSNEPAGIHIESHQYTLFSGSSFTEIPESHRVVVLDPPLQLVSSTTSAEVLFSHGSGELLQHDSLVLSIRDTGGPEERNVFLNALGVVTAAE